jgi:hypothetical protein
MGDAGAAIVAAWLHDDSTRPPHLRILDVNENGISMDGLRLLHDAILRSPRLVNFRFATSERDETQRVLQVGIRAHLTRNLLADAELGSHVHAETGTLAPDIFQRLKHHDWVANITSNYRNA